MADNVAWFVLGSIGGSTAIVLSMVLRSTYRLSETEYIVLAGVLGVVFVVLGWLAVRRLGEYLD